MVKKKVIGVVGPRNTPIGEDHHNAELTDAEVEEIRTMHESGQYGYRRLARIWTERKGFEVTRYYIRDIVTMKRRACTPDNYKTILVPVAETAVKAPPGKEPSDKRQWRHVPRVDPENFDDLV